jgi:hypothetical protein
MDAAMAMHAAMPMTMLVAMAMVIVLMLVLAAHENLPETPVLRCLRGAVKSPDRAILRPSCQVE